MLLRPEGKWKFIAELHSQSKILDVGCGYNSPFRVKQILPECHYTGLDIADCAQTKPNLSDKYIITSPQDFTNEIILLRNTYDAVISSHNLEHCDDRDGTLIAMLDALKEGGKIYMAFPCAQSINFPSRRGTLNYYDDPTHKNLPPNFEKIVTLLERSGFNIEFATKNYSPRLLRWIGFLFEGISRLRGSVMIGTWDYYGFESIIIATKAQMIFSEKK